MAPQFTPLLPHNGPDEVYIPDRAPTDTYRTLVLLFDGTGDKYVARHRSLIAV